MSKIEKRVLVVKYPPAYDGELHVHTKVTPDTISKTCEIKIEVRMLPGETLQDAVRRVGRDMQRAG